MAFPKWEQWWISKKWTKSISVSYQIRWNTIMTMTLVSQRPIWVYIWIEMHSKGTDSILTKNSLMKDNVVNFFFSFEDYWPITEACETSYWHRELNSILTHVSLMTADAVFRVSSSITLRVSTTETLAHFLMAVADCRDIQFRFKEKHKAKK